MKIKTVKSENSENLVKIKIKIKEKKNKIEQNKIKITIAIAIIDVINNPPSTLPPKPTTPAGQPGMETTAAIGPNPTEAPTEGLYIFRFSKSPKSYHPSSSSSSFSFTC